MTSPLEFLSLLPSSLSFTLFCLKAIGHYIIYEAHARPKAWLGPRPAGGKGPTAISFSLLFYYLKQC